MNKRASIGTPVQDFGLRESRRGRGTRKGNETGWEKKRQQRNEREENVAVKVRSLSVQHERQAHFKT